jgi:hypothetical protein
MLTCTSSYFSIAYVTSFHKKQNERFRAISNGEIATGASQHEVTEGVIKFILGLGSYIKSTLLMP